MTISFFAQGSPKGQPRPRAFAHGGRARVFDPGTAEGWKAQVACAACAASEQIEEPVWGSGQPVAVTMRFQFTRPRSHYGTGKNADKLKASAPASHTNKPDLDNLAKAVLDALTTIGIWHDDNQVQQLTLKKAWVSEGRAGAWIRIESVGGAG
jgi:Holliday junction resolvase RusA-like endonuclease